ncbi:hypothetical protein LZ32DRAFT_427253 [Colletotrichum eremochloae]|nr:hypothetical protein LZ32DRAFT_427253 [Colletotrichum eremochloae]
MLLSLPLSPSLRLFPSSPPPLPMVRGIDRVPATEPHEDVHCSVGKRRFPSGGFTRNCGWGLAREWARALENHGSVAPAGAHGGGEEGTDTPSRPGEHTTCEHAGIVPICAHHLPVGVIRTCSSNGTDTMVCNTLPTLACMDMDERAEAAGQP